MIPALSERAFYQDISFLDFQLSRTIPHESRHFVIPAVIEISLPGLWSGGNEGSWLITSASGLRLHDQCHSAAPRTPAAGDALDTATKEIKQTNTVLAMTSPAPLCSPGVQLLRSSGGNIISGHCTMGRARLDHTQSTGSIKVHQHRPRPRPETKIVSINWAITGSIYAYIYIYLRLYLYIYARYAVVAAGWVATLRPPVSSSRQIFRSRTLARQRWWCSCGGQHTGDTQQFANPRPALQHTAACCPVLAAHSDTCPQIYHNRISICINIVTVL